MDARFAREHYRFVEDDGYLPIVIETSIRAALLIDVSPRFIYDAGVARNATILDEPLLARVDFELFKTHRPNSGRVPNKNSVWHEIQLLSNAAHTTS